MCYLVTGRGMLVIDSFGEFVNFGLRENVAEDWGSVRFVLPGVFCCFLLCDCFWLDCWCLGGVLRLALLFGGFELFLGLNCVG